MKKWKKVKKRVKMAVFGVPGSPPGNGLFSACFGRFRGGVEKEGKSGKSGPGRSPGRGPGGGPGGVPGGQRGGTREVEKEGNRGPGEGPGGEGKWAVFDLF